MTPTPHWSDDLVRLDACDQAVEWARTQPDLATALAACPRGDWMVWLWATVAGGVPMSDSRKPVIAALCDIIEELAPPTDPAGIATVSLLRRWIGGEEVTIAEMRSATDYAAYTTTRAATDYATRAVTSAASSASAAASAAAYAARAANAYDYALARAADIVRRHAPAPPAIAACVGAGRHECKCKCKVRGIRWYDRAARCYRCSACGKPVGEGGKP